MVLFFLALFGIRIKVQYNYQRNYLTADLIIFGVWHIMKFRLFIANSSFYYQINRRDFKKLRIKKGKKIIFPPLPNIRFYSLAINVRLGVDDAMKTAVITATLDNVIGLLRMNNKIRFKQFDYTSKPDYEDGNLKLHAELRIKFELYIIVFYLLRILWANIFRRKKDATRRTDVKHA